MRRQRISLLRLIVIPAIALSCTPSFASNGEERSQNDQNCGRAFSKESAPYRLLGPDGQFYWSKIPGTLGGYQRGKIKIYGRLNCKSANNWIKKGHYVKFRVFFASEQDAIAAGFRPCKICKPDWE